MEQIEEETRDAILSKALLSNTSNVGRKSWDWNSDGSNDELFSFGCKCELICSINCWVMKNELMARSIKQTSWLGENKSKNIWYSSISCK